MKSTCSDPLNNDSHLRFTVYLVGRPELPQFISFTYPNLL